MGLYLDGVTFLEWQIISPHEDKCKELRKDIHFLKQKSDFVNERRFNEENHPQPSLFSCRAERFARGTYIRLTMPIHFALEWIKVISFQFFRGTSSLCAGALTLNGKQFVRGLKDYFSLLIQAIALPLIAVPATIHPKTGLSLLLTMSELCNVQKHTYGDLITAFTEKCAKSRYVRVVENIFRSIGAIPNSMILAATVAGHSLLRGKLREVVDDIEMFIVAPVISLVSVFFGGWGVPKEKPKGGGFMASLSSKSDRMYRDIHRLNGIGKIGSAKRMESEESSQSESSSDSWTDTSCSESDDDSQSEVSSGTNYLFAGSSSDF